MSMYPENFRYTKEHEWVRVDGATATVGITDHAQHELGDIVYVDLPKIGTKLAKGATLGSVESVKAVSDVYCPVSGEVTAINEMLATEPEKLNSEPHDGAWLIQLKLSDAAETSDLMTAADYQKYIGA